MGIAQVIFYTYMQVAVALAYYLACQYLLLDLLYLAQFAESVNGLATPIELTTPFMNINEFGFSKISAAAYAFTQGGGGTKLQQQL